MSAPSITWTFTNGTTSDATQVNTNFTDLINGASDGTRDYTIGTLVVNGAVSLKGTVTLGDASADDLTFTGSIASSIPIKTNATYNFGAATTGLLSVYLGNGTKTTRIIAGTIGTSYTITLPNDVPAVTGKTIITDTSGVFEFRYADKFTASKTTTYTATGDETVIPCDASSASFTVTLPAASTMTGKRLTFVKTNSALDKTVTIDANSSEIIVPSAQSSQLTYILVTQYESVTMVCDGSQWYVVGSFTNTQEVDSGPLTITGSTLSPTKGTVARDVFYWMRIGSRCYFRYEYKQTAAGAGATGTGDYQIVLPTGITIDTTKVLVNSTVFGAAPLLAGASNIGVGQGTMSSTNNIEIAYPLDSTRFKVWMPAVGVWSAGAGQLNTAAITVMINGNFPVPGWNN